MRGVSSWFEYTGTISKTEASVAEVPGTSIGVQLREESKSWVSPLFFQSYPQ